MPSEGSGASGGAHGPDMAGDAPDRRHRMVERDIAGRGIRRPGVLAAMREVPRERFLPADLAEFAYEDHPLPISEGQTISQPYIVAAMADAAEVGHEDRVLEIGAGSGYGAAVLSRIAEEVWTVERHEALARSAAGVLEELGYTNAHVVWGDGTLGYPEAAPFDAIVVTAGGPAVPEALLEQLADGGRLVIPVGPETRGQELIRVRRSGGEFTEEDLGPVRFVPLIGAQGHPGATGGDGPDLAAVAGPEPVSIPVGPESPGAGRIVARPGLRAVHGLGALVAETAEPFPSIEQSDVGPLLERIGDCPVVLLGEASHGTSEFYRMRAHITRELIRRKGFTVVAVEADWPDAARIDAWVRHRQPSPPEFRAFSRFPTWMWANRDVAAFVDWLRDHNAGVSDPAEAVAFCGLDLYSLYTSRDAVLAYLDRVDPQAAATARARYSCLSPWEHDPARYGRAVVTGRFAGCEDGVVATLTDLLRERLDYAERDGDAFLEAAQNALVVADAERYYRVMYYGSVDSWNLRDQHMFETLQTVRAHRGPGTKVVIWEHNSHIGDASATEMGARGEHNVGMLCRREYGEQAFLVGFGTDSGTVAAATDWGGPLEVKAVRPSHARSYERVCHDSGVPAFMLALRDPVREEVREELSDPRLERAIGVIYRPETELQSHYFQAVLPEQFDEYVWFDRSNAVTPLGRRDLGGVPDTYPFGL
ncbi:MAG: protein-L-isoaspartate(D-aspartate) O-methyltransferase [Microthrixaceae bacterium]